MFEKIITNLPILKSNIVFFYINALRKGKNSPLLSSAMAKIAERIKLSFFGRKPVKK